MFRASNQRDFCIEFLKKFLLKHLFQKIFIDKCSINSYRPGLFEDPLANEITSLPDKLANSCKIDLK